MDLGKPHTADIAMGKYIWTRSGLNLFGWWFGTFCDKQTLGLIFPTDSDFSEGELNHPSTTSKWRMHGINDGEVDRFDLICLMQLWLMHVEYVDGRYLKHYTGMYIYIYRIIKPTETLMSLAVSILITCLSWIIIGYGHWVFWIVIVAQVLQVVGLPSGIAVFA